MSIDDTERALLAVIEAERTRRVDAILAEARSKVRAILKEAHDRARREVRDAILAARLRADERLITLQARLATARRLNEQRRAAGILATEWAALPDALRARWAHTETRRRWAQHAVRIALGRLPRDDWRIAHPVGWPDVERCEVESMLTGELAAPPRFESDAALAAGLRIHSGRNAVDVTLEGVLADREAIGARLLALTPKETA
jgi:hypothetical protein